MRSYKNYRKAKFLLFLPLGIAFVAGVVFVFMWLWNWLMPMIFGLTIITYWQALGLLFLAKMIFGFGKSWGHSKRYRQSSWYWRKRFMQKWHNMSEEERERWKERMKKRCGEPSEGEE